jgi:HD-like signal output (HDOD) protein
MKLGLPDEAFLAGLIHDIGILVEMQSHRDKLIEVFSEMQFDDNGQPIADMREIEQRIIGADHCEFGAALCDMWKFPKSFAFVAGHHHDPTGLPDGSRVLTAIVYCADHVCAGLGYGFRGDIQQPDILPNILAETRMNLVQLETIKAAMPKAFEDVQATFG